MIRAKFEFEPVPAGLPDTAIVIRDTGHATGTSVTNDAEAVVVQILRATKSLGESVGPNKPELYYYDSTGTMSKLHHDGAEFIGFSTAAKGKSND